MMSHARKVISAALLLSLMALALPGQAQAQSYNRDHRNYHRRPPLHCVYRHHRRYCHR